MQEMSKRCPFAVTLSLSPNCTAARSQSWVVDIIKLKCRLLVSWNIGQPSYLLSYLVLLQHYIMPPACFVMLCPACLGKWKYKHGVWKLPVLLELETKPLKMDWLPDHMECTILLWSWTELKKHYVYSSMTWIITNGDCVFVCLFNLIKSNMLFMSFNKRIDRGGQLVITVVLYYKE